MPKTILLVEDSDDDAFFMVKAFKSIGLVAPVIRVNDGNKAVDYLCGQGDYAERARFPFPGLTLLDIRMPFMSGFEVLRWIRGSSSFASLPVVMLTSSDQECDIAQAYALGANAYLMKPNLGNQYQDLALTIKRFWVDANLLPTTSSPTQPTHQVAPSPAR